MDDDPAELASSIAETLAAAESGGASTPRLFEALIRLRALREHLGRWEPELIRAARDRGASWVELAPALGVASRQAAERRYLRVQPTGTGETNREARVTERREKRAGDRAVHAWARDNAGLLRSIAGQVNALDGLGEQGRARADLLGAALGSDDPADLLTPLAETRPYLTEHTELAREIEDLTNHAGQLRRDTVNGRRQRNQPGSP
ncbi:hypothetical protein [Sciscionella sediminilitoris]|uniref:hypothetical protein n=1 Tax=Sciscionella sediminilitoris TaxID=1445613 RepID=UPI0004DED004|nr:hypothetical protein [Sciscionella sp. SE31]